MLNHAVLNIHINIHISDFNAYADEYLQITHMLMLEWQSTRDRINCLHKTRNVYANCPRLFWCMSFWMVLWKSSFTFINITHLLRLHHKNWTSAPTPQLAVAADCKIYEKMCCLLVFRFVDTQPPFIMI